MNDRRREDRLYTAVVLSFLVGMVGLGLLGIPALLVAAIGTAIAAVGIVFLRRHLAVTGGSAPRGPGTQERVPATYVPSVLEGSSARRRRTIHLRRRRQPSAPLRFR
jgi:hypothetical protein